MCVRIRVYIYIYTYLFSYPGQQQSAGACCPTSASPVVRPAAQPRGEGWQPGGFLALLPERQASGLGRRLLPEGGCGASDCGLSPGRPCGQQRVWCFEVVGVFLRCGCPPVVEMRRISGPEPATPSQNTPPLPATPRLRPAPAPGPGRARAGAGGSGAGAQPCPRRCSPGLQPREPVTGPASRTAAYRHRGGQRWQG